LKRRELERHLTAHGCDVLREGANHTIWRNQPADLRAPIPRHREIPPATARAICRQLAIPPPAAHAEQPSCLE
jgi:mRNA interferase HicA